MSKTIYRNIWGFRKSALLEFRITNSAYNLGKNQVFCLFVCLLKSQLNTKIEVKMLHTLVIKGIYMRKVLIRDIALFFLLIVSE